VRLTKTSLLDAPPAWVWERIVDPDAMQRVAAPLVAIEAGDPPAFPERWAEGETYETRLKLLGLLPAGEQTIAPRELVEDEAESYYRFEDDGHGTLFPTWNHVMTVQATSDGRTVYTDEIEVGAGPLTPVAYLATAAFVAHRHRRWRSIVDEEAPTP
jgi:ligand-binding SRPBCC domain-containing protein